ncbi:hypothetical protein [Parafrankia sp. EUN1f]|uniref:hypothetical protein n=1 Tax=Parafrankia sp. EUN1f TaxID=102897 RepID=UPI0001C46CFC|nr:hypothetical protein [Parafrankia sp. EUN1f]EFC80171.1 hypothetical protein FrEUN1fDRAFT_6700 [Parafrankia sp. EUN1f]
MLNRYRQYIRQQCVITPAGTTIVVTDVEELPTTRIVTGLPVNTPYTVGRGSGAREIRVEVEAGYQFAPDLPF